MKGRLIMGIAKVNKEDVQKFYDCVKRVYEESSMYLSMSDMSGGDCGACEIINSLEKCREKSDNTEEESEKLQYQITKLQDSITGLDNLEQQRSSIVEAINALSGGVCSLLEKVIEAIDGYLAVTAGIEDVPSYERINWYNNDV